MSENKSHSLCTHLSPTPPYWQYCRLPGPVATRHEYACFLYILNRSSALTHPTLPSPHCKQTWQKGVWKKKKGCFKNPSSFLVFWTVFLTPGTWILPGHLKGQKVPGISDEGPDVLLGFPIGCSLMGMREIMYLLSSIQKSQSVWSANPWLKKVNI